MKKEKTFAFGKHVYLLGKGKDGNYYWIEEGTWDCDWYWGGGYVEVYTNQRKPAYAKDIMMHSHFDSMFMNGKEHAQKMFTDFFEETPFTDKEIWTICELMSSFYIARKYSDMLYRGGSNYTSNPATKVIKDDDEYHRINEKVIPAILEELYKILEEN